MEFSASVGEGCTFISIGLTDWTSIKGLWSSGFRQAMELIIGTGEGESLIKIGSRKWSFITGLWGQVAIFKLSSLAALVKVKAL